MTIAQPQLPLPKNGPNYAQFSSLRPGRIHPKGWLKQWAQINADGWLQDYARHESPKVYGKFWNRNQTPIVQYNENHEVLSAIDYAGYFADGILRYATLLPESALAQKAVVWMEQLLASQDTDGYIGPFILEARWQHEHEILTQSLTIEGLLHRYEYTGTAQILSVCERVAQLQLRAWQHDNNNPIFDQHGTTVIRALGKLYELTGNIEYLNFAKEVLDRFGKVKAYLASRDALLGDHDVAGTEHIGLPITLFEYTGEPSLLNASKAAWAMMVQNHLSVDGTPHGNEAMWFKGPLQNCEHCGTVEWFITSNTLARITGEVKYADAAERALLNAYPAAKSSDGMMVAYMHTPNQLVASEWSQPHLDYVDGYMSRQFYHTAQEPLCCNVNGPRAIPYYIQSMIMNAGNGLAIVYYGLYEVSTALPNAGQVVVRMETGYPFEDDILLTVTPAKSSLFPLLFRIPTWCSSAAISINHEPWSYPIVPGTFTKIARTWQAGDTVEIHFEVPLHLIECEQSEFGVHMPGIALQRGPITYALPVTEQWQQFISPGKSPVQAPGQGVTSFRVFSTVESKWNYAMVINKGHPEDNIHPVRLHVPENSLPWEHPPIGLQVCVRRVLNWFMEGEPSHPRTPALPYHPMQLSDEEEMVTMVPFGFTHLRMTYLPFTEKDYD